MKSILIKIIIDLVHHNGLSSGLINTIYENVRPFQIAPGHRILIENFPDIINRIKTTEHPINIQNDTSLVLQLLIEASKKNFRREPKGRIFEDEIRLFATYLYLMCGRACYDTLCANLPIPQSSTIRAYFSPSFSHSFVNKVY